jgi:lipoprotein-anchoring transpeptidase ErfK/SrfK
MPRRFRHGVPAVNVVLSRVMLTSLVALCGPAPALAQSWQHPAWQDESAYGYQPPSARDRGGYDRDGSYRQPSYVPADSYERTDDRTYRRPSPPQPPVARTVQRAPVAGLPIDFVEQVNNAPHSGMPGKGDKPDPMVVKLQVLLDRSHVSPGVIDGRKGGNLSKAISALQSMHNLPANGRLGPEIWHLLEPVAGRPILTDYAITEKDVVGPFVPDMPKDYAEMAQLPALSYRDPVEALAERFHMDETFLRRLNPDADFTQPGTIIAVTDVGANARAKVAHLVADASTRQLIGYNESWDVVVAYPATIGSAALPSPSGVHAVKAVAENPDYWYRPQVNFQQGNNTKALRLPGGPNNPVGTVWIGLDKPTYGIHGSPEPSKIDKTNSHGCLRLTNWDAQELVKLVRVGVNVEFVDQTPTASVAPAAPQPYEAASGYDGQQPMPPQLR